MKTRGLLHAILVAVFMIAPVQGYPEDSLEGEWWIAIKGRTKGAAKLVFSDLVGGAFKVAGRGTTLSLGEFFVVSPNQFLGRASNGTISGSVMIEDENGDALGAFEFDKGGVNNTFTKLTLKGALTNGSTVKVKFIGQRFSSETPLLSGLSQEAKVSGRGLKSKFYELLVIEDGALDAPFLGFPFFDYGGIGPVKVDGTEINDVATLGELVLDPKLKAYGTFFSNDFGDGPASGKLREGETSNIPRIKLMALADRTVKLKANLEQAVSPRISVDPESTLDFESVDVGDTKTLSFTVSNTGKGTLSGSASVETVGSPYSVVSGSPYNLDEGASTTVGVSFEPTATGTFTADVAFTGGGGAARTLTGVGTDPDGTLSVDPSDALVFGNIVLGATATRSFTVTNTGSGQLNGAATISGSNEFQLLNDLDQPVVQVPYILNTNASTTVRVRFAPFVLGNFSAIASFTGGDGTTRAVNGTGTTP